MKIIATLGPATSTPERIRGLMTAGASVFRLNLSHGAHEEHAEMFAAVRRTAGELGRHAAVLLDLQGPKIRVVGIREDAPLELVAGQKLLISSQPVYGKPDTISTNYPRLHEVMSPGGRILLDDGRMELRVKDI
ncbi:MAG: pyruvate kinase, partial [Dehalococcoidia bacterium]|nr:pyruvate kinase [Dehalococcoidia bacterium]